jgi:hypothetical protein
MPEIQISLSPLVYLVAYILLVPIFASVLVAEWLFEIPQAASP